MCLVMVSRQLLLMSFWHTKICGGKTSDIATIRNMIRMGAPAYITPRMCMCVWVIGRTMPLYVMQVVAWVVLLCRRSMLLDAGIENKHARVDYE